MRVSGGLRREIRYLGFWGKNATPRTTRRASKEGKWSRAQDFYAESLTVISSKDAKSKRRAVWVNVLVNSVPNVVVGCSDDSLVPCCYNRLSMWDLELTQWFLGLAPNLEQGPRGNFHLWRTACDLTPLKHCFSHVAIYNSHSPGLQEVSCYPLKTTCSLISLQIANSLPYYLSRFTFWVLSHLTKPRQDGYHL
jgi:hypothetical protein